MMLTLFSVILTYHLAYFFFFFRLPGPRLNEIRRKKTEIGLLADSKKIYLNVKL